jgi:hypothetical protein
MLASPLASYVSGAELRVDGGGEIPGRFAVAHPWSADGAAGEREAGRA